MENAKKKYPLAAIILLILFYLTPFFALAIITISVYEITPDECTATMTAPKVFIYFIVFVILSISGIFSFANNYNKYDGTKEGAKKLTFLLRLTGYLTIVFALLNAIIYGNLFSNSFNNGNFGRTLSKASVVSTTVGLTLIWDMFFYLW